MTWRGAATWWLIALAVGTAYVADQEPTPGRTLPVEPPAPAHSPSYALDRKSLASVALRRGDAVVAWERADGGWRVVEPAGRAVPAGLLDAFVEQLVDGSSAERMDGGDNDPAVYGLLTPNLVIVAKDREGKATTLTVGERTPTRTAAYGRVDETGAVFLVGLNLLYYADLLFDAAR